MGKFKRFCMIAFVIASVLSVGVLAALWFSWQPLFPAISWLVATSWFFTVEAILLGIMAVGLLVIFVDALVAPSRNSKLEMKRDGGCVAITQGALQSTVRHVIENHSDMKVDNIKIHIENKNQPRLSIHAKIDPGHNAGLGTMGTKLQNEIAASIEAFTEFPVDSVRITFTGDADAVTRSFTQKATSKNIQAKELPA